MGADVTNHLVIAVLQLERHAHGHKVDGLSAHGINHVLHLLGVADEAVGAKRADDHAWIVVGTVLCIDILEGVELAAHHAVDVRVGKHRLNARLGTCGD